MIVRKLSAAAVAGMPRTDLADTAEEPESPIEPFSFHGCHCAVASYVGEPPWEFHADDELLHVLGGTCRLIVREVGGERSADLVAGDLVVVPRRRWHRTQAAEGVTMLFMTPAKGGRRSWEDPGEAA